MLPVIFWDKTGPHLAAIFTPGGGGGASGDGEKRGGCLGALLGLFLLPFVMLYWLAWPEIYFAKWVARTIELNRGLGRRRMARQLLIPISLLIAYPAVFIVGAALAPEPPEESKPAAQAEASAGRPHQGPGLVMGQPPQYDPPEWDKTKPCVVNGQYWDPNTRKWYATQSNGTFWDQERQLYRRVEDGQPVEQPAKRKPIVANGQYWDPHSRKWCDIKVFAGRECFWSSRHQEWRSVEDGD